jgi:hypothetical protein
MSMRANARGDLLGGILPEGTVGSVVDRRQCRHYSTPSHNARQPSRPSNLNST